MTLADTAGRIFTDQTGRFPITSNRGNAYLVIFYVYDANFIASVPIKNRTKEELLCAYQVTYNYLTARGFKPRLHKMDNETSHNFKTFVASQNTNLQYIQFRRTRNTHVELSLLRGTCQLAHLLSHRKLVSADEPM